MTPDGLPEVHVVGSPLGTVDGVTVAVVTVEAWYDHLTVRLAAVVDQRLQAELSLWSRPEAERRSKFRAGGGDVPPHPAEPVLRRVIVDVTDDAGTAYTRVSGFLGGMHTELLAEWHFDPLPGPAVRTLTVSARRVDEPRRVLVRLR
jgi:hypothetical protein